ncbi:hypothetical protein O181_068733 [Austropuccinia psidii MF-1]|uniref:Reverse transcriptase domain-containing protein n=1 Tax=Austropuccinia psidii MF-1 TaxID=1389203 RepID=A0A9Q3F0Y0_9BASI|nr:hypothetical protein [Austropuccinia psidii MF-1]
MNKDCEIISDNRGKAKLLFEGASVIDSPINYENILTFKNSHLHKFPPINKNEVRRAIQGLPKKKEPGPEEIKKELLKTVDIVFTPHLVKLFNAFLKIGYFPKEWNIATTSIIRKAGKDDYYNPTSYRPIELLNSLSKLFEKIIKMRLSFWAEHTGALSDSHIGGRPGRRIYDAFVMITSWIKDKWRKNKLVLGCF